MSFRIVRDKQAGFLLHVPGLTRPQWFPTLTAAKEHAMAYAALLAQDVEQ